MTATATDVTESLEDRAARIFGRAAGNVRWPYGLGDPRYSARPEDRQEFERQLIEQPRKQQTVVEWAEANGLRASKSGCCPQWLLRGSSRRCDYPRCTKYNSGGRTPDGRWLDHATYWLKDGKPAVITSAPYGVTPEHNERLNGWVDAHPELRVAFGGEGWYGHCSTQIVMWRIDRIDGIEPVDDAVRPDVAMAVR